MRYWKGLARFVLLSVGLALAGLMGSPTSARAGGVGTIVPAYFYPGTGGPGGVGDGWAAMTAAASKIPLTAIFNPASGPQPGPPDPNYVNAMTSLENAGGHVVAYVFTNDGNTPLATVESQINLYLTQYGKLINGFFLDAMFIHAAIGGLPNTLPYYQSINSYIKSLGAYNVIGNPGQPFLNGISPQDYLSTANVFNIFEGTDASFKSYPFGLNWFQSFPSSRFSNIIHDVPTASGMQADLTRAVQLNAGSVFITDGSGGNPYSQLPSYWDQEVAAIASASVPEPGVLTNLVLAAVCGSLAMAVRRRYRA
jgi:hypothetical protein